MMSLVINFGTVAVIGLGLLLFVVRYRYYASPELLALALTIAASYILFAGVTRFVFTNWSEVMPSGYNRAINGIAAIVALGILALTLVEAELQLRFKKGRVPAHERRTGKTIPAR